MQRYILNDETKTFYNTDINHIKKVMRMKTGDQVIVCLNEKCSVAKLIINKDSIEYEVVEDINTKRTRNITLIQGLLKGSKIETTIKYSTIFGVRKIIITPFERSITNKVKNIEHKKTRYFNIAKEAAELSHRSSIPNILFSNKLEDIKWDNFDYIILADELIEKKYINDYINEIDENKKIAIIVGPEGGISDNERIYLKDKKAFFISLGEYIYPAEIAAISLLEKIDSLF